ncbi:DUF2493 domain-containing protein (plasmid) [Brevundimonas sp. BH3]|uniref:DUF2493 domain-containing protein n=1 Tax=Brevundimonas sp. BH3 TaxID=3133089 RepID=UPI003158DFB8
MADGNFISDASITGAQIEELTVVGYRPFSDEIDRRPMPETAACQQAMSDVFDAIGSTFEDTRLEEDLADVMWGFVNIFHRKVSRLDADLDRNEVAQRDSQAIQDGSEIRSVELERLTAEGMGLIERRNAFEALRDMAADHYAVQTGSLWTPAYGSKVNRVTATAAMLDSRDFINARRKADNDAYNPTGPMIGFIASTNYNDYDAIWKALDKAHAKYPTMTLAHTGDNTGAPKIASAWAQARKVPQISYSPDFKKHLKSAPFKRNDQMLAAKPIGIIAGPGNGVRDNLVDKARQQGISVMEIS